MAHFKMHFSATEMNLQQMRIQRMYLALVPAKFLKYFFTKIASIGIEQRRPIDCLLLIKITSLKRQRKPSTTIAV